MHLVRSFCAPVLKPITFMSSQCRLCDVQKWVSPLLLWELQHSSWYTSLRYVANLLILLTIINKHLLFTLLGWKFKFNLFLFSCVKEKRVFTFSECNSLWKKENVVQVQSAITVWCNYGYNLDSNHLDCNDLDCHKIDEIGNNTNIDIRGFTTSRVWLILSHSLARISFEISRNMK